MSWGFSFNAKTKKGAVQKVREIQEKSDGHYPKEIADGLISQIERMTDQAPTYFAPAAPVIRVESSGHFDSVMGGSESTKIHWDQLVE